MRLMTEKSDARLALHLAAASLIHHAAFFRWELRRGS